jgi:hypothetical protein
MNKTEILNSILKIWNPEDYEEATVLRAIYDGKSAPSDDMVNDFRNLDNDYELTDEESDALANATDDELRQALTEYIKDFVEEQMDEEYETITEAVSDWFDGHCHSDDFDSEYERQQYFQDLINGNGDSDYIYDSVIDDIEYQFLTEEEVSDKIEEAIVDEASYWAD